MTTTSTHPVVRPLPLGGQRSWRPSGSLPHAPAYAQGALALSYPLPQGLESTPRPTALVVVRHGTPPNERAGPEAWAATFIQAVVEVVASDRPITQLIRWTSRGVYAEIARQHQLVTRHRGPTAVRSHRQHVATVRVCQPDAGSAEVAARITFGPRSKALAARFDFAKERWLCTAICFG
jgi:uncharacterized protein DUF6459